MESGDEVPSIITHYLFAKRLKNSLDEKLHKDAFFWGAQGPDFILTHNFLCKNGAKSIKKCGMYLQDMKFDELLKQLKEYVKIKNNNFLVKSYIKGLISHYVLDTMSFDFISYQAESLKSKSKNNISLRASRNEVKSALDNIILRYEEGNLPNEINFKHIIPKNNGVFDVMHNFYYYIIRKNFDKTVALEDIKAALNGYRKLVQFVDDRFFIKKPIVKFIEKLLKKDSFISNFFRDMVEPDDFDFANIAHHEWRWPKESDEFKQNSFIDIYEKSLNIAQNSIKLLDS